MIHGGATLRGVRPMIHGGSDPAPARLKRRSGAARVLFAHRWGAAGAPPVEPGHSRGVSAECVFSPLRWRQVCTERRAVLAGSFATNCKAAAAASLSSSASPARLPKESRAVRQDPSGTSAFSALAGLAGPHPVRCSWDSIIRRHVLRIGEEKQEPAMKRAPMTSKMAARAVARNQPRTHSGVSLPPQPHVGEFIGRM